MKLACDIIRDLLPLYIDDVCSEESRAAVQAHLEDCADCRSHHDAMQAEEVQQNTNDIQMESGLKDLRNKINRRVLRAAVAVAALLVLILGGIHVLFDMPLKALSPEEMQVSAAVYSVDELPEVQAESGHTIVSISKGEEDTSDLVTVQIPDLNEAQISITENVLEETEYITVIDWFSNYNIREMGWSWSEEEEGTIYVDSARTTLLGNRAKAGDMTQKTIEMRKIDRVVYINVDGSETILWQLEAGAGEGMDK